MESPQRDVDPIRWMGGVPGAKETAGPADPFDTGELWFGRHRADLDVLVLDPSETDARADPVTMYSLTQHRARSFPRAVVRRQIQALTDDDELEQARSDYENRAALRQAHEEEAATAAAQRTERLHERLLASHRTYLGELGIEYAGVSETAGKRASGSRSRCHACGIAIDDFAGVACVACGSALCSCGACGCGRPRRGRSRAVEEEEDG